MDDSSRTAQPAVTFCTAPPLTAEFPLTVHCQPPAQVHTRGMQQQQRTETKPTMDWSVMNSAPPFCAELLLRSEPDTWVHVSPLV